MYLCGKGETMKLEMNRKLMMNLITLFIMGLLPVQVSGGELPVLKNEKDKTNYSIGVGVARNFQRQQIDLDADLVIKGMRDTLLGEKLLMTEDDLNKTLNAFQTELRQKQEKMWRTAMEDNKKAGDAFLAENKKKEGVVVLPSGLQYKIIKAGNGKKPTEADTVECRYRGTLLDGTEFDSSDRSGQPTVAMEVKSLILGCREALKLMPVGSKWQLFIPPELAYGTRGFGINIGPNATLVFEVELLAIK
jgi:FKBP-type peptidyl-prolyl cis-trans isomerase